MEYRLPGSAYCDWCGAETSLPARLCVVSDPDTQDCLCDSCGDSVEAIKRATLADRLLREISGPETGGPN